MPPHFNDTARRAMVGPTAEFSGVPIEYPPSIAITWSGTPLGDAGDLTRSRGNWGNLPANGDTPELICNFDEPTDPTTWPRASLNQTERLQLSEIVTSMASLAALLRPEDAPTEQEFMVLAEQALYAGSQSFGERQALEWAGGYVIPEQQLLKDSADFMRLKGDLQSLVRERWHSLGQEGLTIERANHAFSERNPHLPAVRDVATGVHVLLPPFFQPNSLANTLPKRTPTYERLAPVVNKAFWSSHVEIGAAFTLPLATLREVNAVFHVSAASWAPKEGKAEGRPITDASNGRTGTHVLNHNSVKVACEERWGAIDHPTIDTIVRMVLLAEERYPNDEILFWAMDIKGAYTQLRFRPEDVHLMAVNLSDDVVMFFIGGIFGWTGMPFSFDPISRAIRWELEQSAHGIANIYVDDILGASPARLVRDDLVGATRLLTNIFGEGGISTKKTRASRVGDAIGYTLNLKTRLVTIAKKNVLRALYGFMSVQAHTTIPFKTMEKLASWGSRYAGICLYLQPFTHTLFQALQRGRRGHNVFIPIRITPGEWRVILLFQAMLALTVLRARTYARSFDSFAVRANFPHGCTLMVFDASLTGAGMLVYSRSLGDLWSPVGGAIVSLRSLNFGTDSSNQNLAELIAATLAVRLAATLRLPLDNAYMGGDSVTALRWVETRRAHSAIATNAAIVFALQGIASGLHIADTGHILAENNWRCDTLSRDVPWSQFTEAAPEWKGIHPTTLEVTELLRACDPSTDWESSPGLWGLAQDEAWRVGVPSA